MQTYNEEDDEQNDPTEFLAMKSKAYLQVDYDNSILCSSRLSMIN